MIDPLKDMRVLDIGACPGTLAIHFAGPTSWDRQSQEQWPKLHGRAYQPGPKGDVLYQMGIYNLPAGAQHALPITG